MGANAFRGMQYACQETPWGLASEWFEMSIRGKLRTGVCVQTVLSALVVVSDESFKATTIDELTQNLAYLRDLLNEYRQIAAEEDAMFERYQEFVANSYYIDEQLNLRTVAILHERTGVTIRSSAYVRGSPSEYAMFVDIGGKLLGQKTRAGLKRIFQKEISQLIGAVDVTLATFQDGTEMPILYQMVALLNSRRASAATGLKDLEDVFARHYGSIAPMPPACYADYVKEFEPPEDAGESYFARNREYEVHCAKAFIEAMRRCGKGGADKIPAGDWENRVCALALPTE